MEKISICGINCCECEAYLATINDDDQKRKDVAEQWSKQYEADIKPESINCHGCTSQNKILFNHCTVCEIRACGIKHKVKNCAHCPDYICDKLEKFFQMVPPCRDTLNKINTSL